MRLNHQRGIEQRQAEIVRAVREWALANGWMPATRGNALHKTVDGEERRLDFGRRNLREQSRGASGQSQHVYWQNIRSCPWSLVTVESGAVVFGKNSCRRLHKPETAVSRKRTVVTR